MQRQSARKVKLTSKFEEFSTSRLASIQRLAHQADTPTPKAEKIITPKVEPTKVIIETPKVVEHHNHAPVRVPQSTPIRTPQTTTSIRTPQTAPLPKLTANGKIRGRPRKCWPKPETTPVVKPISSTREELLRLREENANLKVQLEQRTTDFEELKRQSSYTGQTVPKVDYDDLKERYQRDLTQAKRREWCVVCLNPSRYHCCWNTTYCSQKCQVADWYSRHIKSCERRRALKTVS